MSLFYSDPVDLESVNAVDSSFADNSAISRSVSVPCSPMSLASSFEDQIEVEITSQIIHNKRTRSKTTEIDQDHENGTNHVKNRDFYVANRDPVYSTPISQQSALSCEMYSTPPTTPFQSSKRSKPVISLDTPVHGPSVHAYDRSMDIFPSSPSRFSVMPDVSNELDNDSDGHASLEESSKPGKPRRLDFSTTSENHSGSNNFQSNSTNQFINVSPNGTSTSHEVGDRSHPSACLFVASLSSSHTLENLREAVAEIFAKWSPIDVTTHRDSADRPYAFVQMRTYEDARDALSECRGALIFDRPIRCEHARVNRALFLASSSKIMLRREAEIIFEKFGQLEFLISATTQYGRGVLRGWCGKFEYREDAIEAYFLLKQNDNFIMFYVQNPDPRIPTSMENPSIFIRNLDVRKVTRDLLNERFAKYGKILDIELLDQASSDLSSGNCVE
ncbi:hypothetical protein V1512DRAFT_109061 [Lipomyces arxii]|uniref:uncharacterized protein n=1 Tax=Lipomyces arxii TaxID=56418 RepID=UPI0034CEE7A0